MLITVNSTTNYNNKTIAEIYMFEKVLSKKEPTTLKEIFVRKIFDDFFWATSTILRSEYKRSAYSALFVSAKTADFFFETIET